MPSSLHFASMMPYGLLLRLLLASLCLTTTASAMAASHPRIVGVKLTRMESDAATVAADLAAAGVNTVFAPAKLLESEEVLSACHARGMAVYAIFGIFVNAAAIREDPSLSQINALGLPMTAQRKNYRLVCPNRLDYRAKRIGEITTFMQDHAVDGLSLDFIRYGVEWEMIKPADTPGLDQEYCFCPVCLEKFSRSCPLPESKTIPETARFILGQHRAEWTAFKCQTIATMIAQIKAAARKINPDIRIAIHALPWTDGDYDDGPRRLGGQDFRMLTRDVDLFSPMCYHYMLYREPDSIHRQVVYMKELGCRVAPCIQAGLIFRKDDGFTPEVFDQAMNNALRAPSDGINLYIWRYLAADPTLQEMWRRQQVPGRCPGL